MNACLLVMLSILATNIGKLSFLKLIHKHFPEGSQLNKIFKLSYSCMFNAASIIKSHNKKVSSTKEDQQEKAGKLCNCRKNTPCPLQGKCLTPSIIYKTEVKVGNEDNAKVCIFKRLRVYETLFQINTLSLGMYLLMEVWQLETERKPTLCLIQQSRNETNVCDSFDQNLDMITNV